MRNFIKLITCLLLTRNDSKWHTAHVALSSYCMKVLTGHDCRKCQFHLLAPVLELASAF